MLDKNTAVCESLTNWLRTNPGEVRARDKTTLLEIIADAAAVEPRLNVIAWRLARAGFPIQSRPGRDYWIDARNAAEGPEAD